VHGIDHRWNQGEQAHHLVLGFVGVKMLVGAFDIVGIHIEIPIVVSLAVIAITLTVSIVASIIVQRREERQLAQLSETNE